MTTPVSVAAISRKDLVGGSMTKPQIVEMFMRDEISASDMLTRLSLLDRAHATLVEHQQVPVSATLVRAQAAIRRISGT
jgi:hypothetical protein